MIWEKYKLWITLVVVNVVCVFGVVTINKYIDNQISIRVQKIEEAFEKQKAEIQINLTKEKNDLENNLKTKIIILETEYTKCKLAAEENTKKQEYKKMSKEDPKRFRKELEQTLGVKGKKQ